MELQKATDKKKNFFNQELFLKKDKNRFLWLGNSEQLNVLINGIPFCQSSNELIDLIFFSNNNFISETNDTFILFEKLKKIDYNQLVISLIFNYLQINYKQKNMSLGYEEWVNIIPIFVKPKISNSVLSLMNELNVIEFLIKTKTKSQFKIAVLLYFNTISSFNSSYCDLKGIINLLNFLKVEKSLTKSLIENQKNFDDLTEFLMAYNFDDPLTSA